jgi:hypothetical protein
MPCAPPILNPVFATILLNVLCGNLQVHPFKNVLSRIETSWHYTTEECHWHKVDSVGASGVKSHHSALAPFLVVCFNRNNQGRAASQTNYVGLHAVEQLCHSSLAVAFTMKQGISASVAQTLLNSDCEDCLPLADTVSTYPTMQEVSAVLLSHRAGEVLHEANDEESGDDADTEKPQQDKKAFNQARMIAHSNSRPNVYLSETVKDKHTDSSVAPDTMVRKPEHNMYALVSRISDKCVP